jgi:glutaredoxin-like YruB-family protein
MAKVKIYSTPTCPYCQMAKEYLKNNKIDYEEYNVAEDEARLKEMVNKSHQMGVPVIDVDGEIVVGFDRALLAKLLHIA